MFRLDYLSCVLTITSTILVGRRCWEGWVLASVNSVIMCIIGIKTAQLGLFQPTYSASRSASSICAPGAVPPRCPPEKTDSSALVCAMVARTSGNRFIPR